jgi:hypothetical protein
MDEKDTLLFSLKIDGLASESVVKKVADEVERLAEATKAMTEADAEAVKQKQLNEKAIEANTAAINKSKAALEAEEGSIKKLRESNKKLTEERNNTTTKTEEGRLKIAAINKELDANNKVIKDNVDNYTKQKMGVGGYREALEGLVPGLKGVTTGIESTTKAGMAFIATPIGLVIAALALGLAAIVAYFKGSEEGADKFAKVSAQLSAIVDVLVDRVIAFGGALVAFLSGEWEEGLSKMETAFSGVGDEIEREVRLAGELAEIFDQLEELELKQSIAISRTANEIKNLLIQSKDRTKTEKERIALQQQALDLERKQAGETQAIQLARISAEATDLQRKFSQYADAQRINESTIEFTTRLLSNEKILYASRVALGDQLIKYNQTQGESLNIQEKILNQQDALTQKAIDKAQKEYDAIQKVMKAELDRMLKIEIAQDKHDAKILDRDLDISKKLLDQKLTANLKEVTFEFEKQRAIDQLRQQALADEKQAIQDKIQAVEASAAVITGILAQANRTQNMQVNAQLSQVKAAEQKKLESLEGRFKSGLIDEKKYNEQKDKIVADATASERKIKKDAFDANKKNQIASTIISTLQAGVNAFTSLSVIPIVGPILGAVAAAAALVFGYKQVSAIRATEFTYATGGVSGTRIMSHHGQRIYRANGDNLLATVRTGEVILNEQQQAALGGPSTFRAAGVPGFNTGGISGGSIETRMASSSASQQRVLEQVAAYLQAPQPPVLVLQDFEVAQDAKNIVQTKSIS